MCGKLFERWEGSGCLRQAGGDPLDLPDGSDLVLSSPPLSWGPSLRVHGSCPIQPSSIKYHLHPNIDHQQTLTICRLSRYHHYYSSSRSTPALAARLGSSLSSSTTHQSRSCSADVGPATASPGPLAR